MKNIPQNQLSSAVLKLFLIIGIVVVLYYGQSLLLTLTVAGLLAMLLNPIDNKLRSWGWSPGLAISGAMLVLLLFFGGLFAAVGQQAVSFVDSWPETKKNISEQLTKLRQEYDLGGIIPSITDNGEKTGENKKQNQGNAISDLPVSRSGIMSFFSGTLGILGDYLLMLVYIVLFLSQKDRLRTFALKRMPDDQRGLTHQTINESMEIVQKYLRGRFILVVILSILYGIGFLLVGLDYALLIAVLVAVLSIIPYLGNLIGGLFAVALAFAGGGGSGAILGVLASMAVAQILESYVLLPLIVGDEVDINPLTTIICVMGMSIVWGPVGAIVAIPVFAIIRVICSHVDGLKDYAYLLGQE